MLALADPVTLARAAAIMRRALARQRAAEAAIPTPQVLLPAQPVARAA